MAVEIGTVRQNSYSNWSEGQERSARLNRRGELVTIDFLTQLILDGRVFHMQLGTEDAPINSTTVIDDQLSFGVADNALGFTMIPLHYACSVATWTTSTLINVMLEIDRALNRYSSGGTAYVPENLRTDRPRAAVGGAFYVGTDVTIAAKTAVPGSIELWRHVGAEDNVGTSTGAENINAVQYTFRTHPIAAIVGVGSAVLHFGVATADVTGYGLFDFGQLPTDSVT